MMKRMLLSVVLAGLCFGGAMQASRLSLPLIQSCIDRANNDILIAEGFYKDIKLMAKKELKDEYLSTKERFKRIVASEVQAELFKDLVLESIDRVIEAIDRSGNIRSSDREFMVFLKNVSVIVEAIAEERLSANEQSIVFFKQVFQSKALVSFEMMLIEKLQLKAKEIKRGIV